MTEAVILAGGLGTRLRDAVPDLPKTMAPVAGQPFLAHLLRYLGQSGVRRAVLAVGYRYEVIQRHFGECFADVELVYSIEHEPLGTGGALLQAMQHVGEPYAFVLNGDTFLGLDYRDLGAKVRSHPDVSLAIVLRRVADASRYGAAIVGDGRLKGFQSRGAQASGLINAGCYVVSRDIFQRYPMPARFSWEDDFLQVRAAEIRPLAFEYDVPFIDIGIPEAFHDAQSRIPEWLSAPA